MKVWFAMCFFCFWSSVNEFCGKQSSSLVIIINCNFYVEDESDRKRRRVQVWESGSSDNENGQFLVKRFWVAS